MPGSALFHEKRLHPRVALNLPVRYRVVDEKTDIKHVSELELIERNVQTRDTSLGGLCILQDGRLAAGKILNLKLQIPGRPDSLSAFADVVWAAGTGAGLKFLVMREKDAKVLALFLRRFPRIG